METVAAETKPMLDLVASSVDRLIQHCENGHNSFLQGMDSLKTDDMKSMLIRYRRLLVREPAIVAAYLNPQVPKPSKQSEVETIQTLIRPVLLRATHMHHPRTANATKTHKKPTFSVQFLKQTLQLMVSSTRLHDTG
jgi:hypothetical protein